MIRKKDWNGVNYFRIKFLWVKVQVFFYKIKKVSFIKDDREYYAEIDPEKSCLFYQGIEKNDKDYIL